MPLVSLIKAISKSVENVLFVSPWVFACSLLRAHKNPRANKYYFQHVVDIAKSMKVEARTNKVLKAFKTPRRRKFDEMVMSSPLKPYQLSMSGTEDIDDKRCNNALHVWMIGSI